MKVRAIWSLQAQTEEEARILGQFFRELYGDNKVEKIWSLTLPAPKLIKEKS